MDEVFAPYLDDNVEYIGVNKMRLLTATALEAMKRPVVIFGRGRQKPLAVLLTYRQYMTVQKILVQASLPQNG